MTARAQATMPPMRKSGTVVKWDDARGFGFIRSAGSSGDVFFHVKDYRVGGGAVPHQGMSVSFEEIHVGGKGPRAMAVARVGESASPANAARPRPAAPARSPARRTDSAPASGAALALPLMAIYAGVLGWAVWTRALPWWVLPASGALSLFTFFAYWQDKYAAGKGAWRISEATLHLWSLAGGWPGAWLAQQALRHKSSKQEFRSVYWATVVLHCTAVGAWLFWRTA